MTPTNLVYLPQPPTSAGRPRQLLITLLGDYWYGRREHLPSAALVDLLREFGVTDASCRVALSRLRSRGVLLASKVGRNTFYGLSPKGEQLFAEGAQRIMKLGTEHDVWSGRWSFIAFSVPETQRKLRHTLRSRLTWLGFAALYDALWVSPNDDVTPALKLLDSLDIETATVVVGKTPAEQPAAGNPIRAWDLRALHEVYANFLVSWSPLRDRTISGEVSAAEALIARTELMSAWRTIPANDPGLPDELLPDDLPRSKARAMFGEIFDGLGPAAARRVREIVSVHDPELAELVTHKRTDFLVAADQGTT